MHLRSLSLKGFKSFPERTRLLFGPGVSVIVGPNGSGKSNVVDAVLWAMGEQSPLAVRGQAMQDVIFGGARGTAARSAAEVELVLDNGDGTLDVPLSEVSISRRLDRDGDGEYRVNGARCRLVDVLEVLSDTGLGQEGHSIVSQGRVEAVVVSKPRDRRLLIEEAAGLGKHRKRRRRAQLKLARTQENLDRALDVEREARSRLRPLKRQAEAAELHARLERQSLEAEHELARDALLALRGALVVVEAEAATARQGRQAVAARLAEVAAARERAEEALGQRAERREALAARAYRARSAAERLELRAEAIRSATGGCSERARRARTALAALRIEVVEEEAEGAEAGRILELERALADLGEAAAAELARELAPLEADAVGLGEALPAREADLEAARSARRRADADADAVRARRREAGHAADASRRDSAQAGAELATVNQFLRAAGATSTASGGSAGRPPRTLSRELSVQPGSERAVSAVLGRRLSAAVVGDRSEAGAVLDRAGADGASALVVRAPAPGSAASAPPSPGAEPMSALVDGGAEALALARALLDGCWLVDDLEAVPEGFTGTAVTRSGRVWDGAGGELRQVPAGGEDRILAERNRRVELVAASEVAARQEQAAMAAAERASAQAREAEVALEHADAALRTAIRSRDDAAEELRQAQRRLETRRRAPAEGEVAARRAGLEAQLAAERRAAERAARERRERARRVAGLELTLERAEALSPPAHRLQTAIAVALDVVATQRQRFEEELGGDRAAGEALAAELRACAAQEAELQAELARRGDALTAAEVRAQQARDRAAEAEDDLHGLAGRLGVPPEPAPEPLDDEAREALNARVQRLARRREALGPVNPLAADEYAEALAHVEELETQRGDLEGALRELRRLIAETDREIRETFAATFSAAAGHFEEIVGRLFPGGRGTLRLVTEDGGETSDRAPRFDAHGGGEGHGDGDGAAEGDGAAGYAAGLGEAMPEDRVGVEIELDPAGKQTRRLSLLSGGEKSLTALAFLFAIFLARPCPFYVLDEVEAALDDVNIDRFLALLRAYADRAQFIVVTHQKRTMEVADFLYGISMGGDGVSRVVSRRLPREGTELSPRLSEGEDLRPGLGEGEGEGEVRAARGVSSAV